MPTLYLGWLPVEITIGERTLKMVAGFSVRPRTNEAEAYRYLLAVNMKAPGFCFGLDAAFGRVVEITESAVTSYLQLAFPRT